MRQWQWERLRPSVGLVSMLCLIGRHVHAQSFDCRKVSTEVEHAICNDKALGELDSSLASELKDSMSAATADQRRDFVWEERRWIAYRDKHCTPASSTEGESLSECLAAVYRERIAYLKSLKGVADLSNCQKIADRYRPLASAHPGEPPLSVLANSPTSGITLAPPLANMTNAASELPVWASKQTPPFLVPEEFTKSLISMAGWTLEKLPNVNFYSLSSIEGTAHCYNSTYFRVTRGGAEFELAPPGFNDEGGASCGVSRTFGRIDDASVFIQENYNWTPQMSSDITVATSNDGGFYSACKVAFLFAPTFSDQTLNSWEDIKSLKACKATECADLRRAAFELAEEVQKNPAEARKRWLTRLSPEQEAEYEKEIKLAARKQSELGIRELPGGATVDQTDADPASITQEAPLHLPYVHHGHVYLASLGHFTIGWRYFADWGVTFEELEDDKLASRGNFAVGMMKGELESVSISAVH